MLLIYFCTVRISFDTSLDFARVFNNDYFFLPVKSFLVVFQLAIVLSLIVEN